MGRIRYESKADQYRRKAKLDRNNHICIGLFLCLTLIGAPIGIIVIVVGLTDYQKSMDAIARYERDRGRRGRR